MILQQTDQVLRQFADVSGREEVDGKALFVSESPEIRISEATIGTPYAHAKCAIPLDPADEV